MFEVLAREGINIDMISTSEIKVSVVLDLARGEQAMRAVHAEFVAVVPAADTMIAEKCV
jgi:aspartate kinase